MMTGDGPAAFAGRVKDNWMVTGMFVSEELSTCPNSRFSITEKLLVALVTTRFVTLTISHVTSGVTLGIRP